jgi:hypothetical protein
MKSVVRSVVSVACVGVGIVAIGACTRDRERERERPGAVTTEEKGTTGTTTVTGANVTSNQAAIEKIVAGRCAREETCKNVGVDKKYTNPQACTQKIKADMKDDLNPKECPRGVDEAQLNKCIDAIRKEDCNNPIDSLSRVVACRTGDLCVKR